MIYWQQWDAADLRSWQGIEEISDIHEEKDDEDIEKVDIEQEDPFTGSMDDYGLSWRDFV